MNIIIVKELFDTAYSPKNVKYKKEIKHKGTNSAYELYRATFKTDKGNKVDVLIIPKGNKAYEVSFFVNNEMKETQRSEIDRQILMGVFSLLPKVAEKFDMEEIRLESWTDGKEFKRTKNLDVEKPRRELINLMTQFIKKSKSGEINFYNDTERNISISMANNFLKKGLSNVDALKSMSSLSLSPYNAITKEIDEAYKKYRKAFLSNTEEGFLEPKNRRHEIYKKLLPKFMPNWDIKEINNGPHTYMGFELTKK